MPRNHIGKNIRTLVFFLIIVVGGGFVIGIVTAPGSWYAAIVKPGFNPPNWVFAPVWTGLYICIAFAGWRIWLAAPRSGKMIAWLTQLALNFAWPPVLFSMHRMDIALGIIVMLLITIIVFIVAAWPRNRMAAYLFIPYMFWVAFAALLNGSLIYLNAEPSG